MCYCLISIYIFTVNYKKEMDTNQNALLRDPLTYEYTETEKLHKRTKEIWRWNVMIYSPMTMCMAEVWKRHYVSNTKNIYKLILCINVFYLKNFYFRYLVWISTSSGELFCLYRINSKYYTSLYQGIQHGQNTAYFNILLNLL